ncbi:MAG: hypothetical protein EP299_01190 [Acidobacteria bacterium]|nr:MAG: hypothetical protein EP299_01190 [Acidobacteriota bacterium]
MEKKEDRSAGTARRGRVVGPAASSAEEAPASRLMKPAEDEPLAVGEQLGEVEEAGAPQAVAQSKPEPMAMAAVGDGADEVAEADLEDQDRSRADTESDRMGAGESVLAEGESRQLAELEPDAEGAELRSQLEEVRPESAAPARAKMRAVQAPPEPEPTPAPTDFIISMATDPDDAASRLGGELRTLPDLDLRRVEVMPGSGVEGGLDHLPAVRMIYLDAAGHEIVLLQQLLAPGDRATVPAEPTLVVEPSGLKSYRWRDSEGYLLILQGEVSSDSLRALADLVR